jgi:AraC-like DNA-binding protein
VLAVVVGSLDSKRAATDALLSKHGLHRSNLTDPYNVVSLRRYIAFFEEAAVLANDPSLGLRLGMAIRPEQIGPLGVLFVMFPSLRAGITRLSRFFPALQGRTKVSFENRDGDWCCDYEVEDIEIWPRRQDSEFTLALICALVRSRMGHAWKPLEVHFEHPAPSDPRDIQRFFDAIVRFEQQTNRIIVDERDLDVSVPFTDQSAASIIEQHLSDLIGESQRRGDLEENVGDAVSYCMKHGSVTIEEVARRIGMGARTLQRRLSQRGISFKQIVKSRRIIAAEALLAGNVCSLGTIAHNLGYADVSAMSRAFKTWTGSSPRVYAKTRLQGPN